MGLKEHFQKISRIISQYRERWDYSYHVTSRALDYAEERMERPETFKEVIEDNFLVSSEEFDSLRLNMCSDYSIESIASFFAIVPRVVARPFRTISALREIDG